MIINRGEIRNFRNIKCEIIEFSKSVNFFTGKNGSGKTNLIEAISIVSNLKSFRNVSDANLINWESNGYYVLLDVFSDTYESYEVGCFNDSGEIRKKYKIAGVVKSSAREYYGNFITTIFSPDDISLIDGIPEKRRKYFDSVISKIDKEYMAKLYDFKNILSSRNNLLKSIKQFNRSKKSLEELDVWDDLFASASLFLMQKRKSFILKYREYFNTSYSYITNINDVPILDYKASLQENDSENTKMEIFKNRKFDFNIGTTTKGPHRDIYYFKNQNNREFLGFCSQGQKRTAAIAIKNAEKTFIEFITGKKAVLLVDDIFSELDYERKKNMIGLLRDGNQVMFTMVSVDQNIINSFDEAKIFCVNNGLISEAI
jgi:DNA replication and repair protein RecF